LPSSDSISITDIPLSSAINRVFMPSFCSFHGYLSLEGFGIEEIACLREMSKTMRSEDAKDPIITTD
jgi:hypothetical protein